MNDKKPDFNKNNQLVESKQYKRYWRRLMDSTRCRMSRGAQNIKKIISWARGDNWRRKNDKK